MKKLAFLLLLPGLLAAAENGRRLVRIRIDQPAQVRLLLSMDLDLAGRGPDGSLDAVLSPAEETALQRQGFSLEPLTPAAGLEKTAAALSGDMGAYHTYQELSEELAALAESYPDILRLTSIGRSIEGREIWAVKISDHPELEEADEAEVLLTAAIHAREIITPEIILDLIHYLTTLYGQDSLLTRLVDERQIWLVPMINPDGHVRVENGDIWWRKNCRINTDGSIGVDLNRNFGYKWGYNPYGSSPTPYSETYRGPAAFSEPETAALRDLAAAHHFAAVINYHSYSRLALFPWSYIARHSSHHAVFLELARNLTRASGYGYGDTAMGVLYETNGDSDDYFYGSSLERDQPSFSLTIEVGTDFHPAESEMSQLISENRPASLYIAWVADKLHRDPWQIVPDSARTGIEPDALPPVVEQPAAAAPQAFVLAQNWPNPFNAATTLRYTLAQEAWVRLTLFDARGRSLRTLLSALQPAGTHELRFDAAGLPSGVYFCRIEAGEPSWPAAAAGAAAPAEGPAEGSAEGAAAAALAAASPGAAAPAYQPGIAGSDDLARSAERRAAASRRSGSALLKLLLLR
ncbi:MAG TPA: M14 family zinc carboxypeptidase [bacterium]|nr:M14 family zinc carboxypeptidase [bacterium]